MVKQISDIEIYLLIKYIKSVLWSVAKFLSYIEEARCLKVKLDMYQVFINTWRSLTCYTQSNSVGKVNIFGGGSIGNCVRKISYEHVSNYDWLLR